MTIAIATIWLLVSVGQQTQAGSPTVVVAQFIRAEQCESTRKQIQDAYDGNGSSTCSLAR